MQFSRTIKTILSKMIKNEILDFLPTLFGEIVVIKRILFNLQQSSY